MEIPNVLHNEIINFCKLNEISDVDDYILQLIVTGFNLSKYGASPLVSRLIEEPKPRIIPYVPPEKRTNILESNTNKNKDIYNED
jgi:hypothetical protein